MLRFIVSRQILSRVAFRSVMSLSVNKSACGCWEEPAAKVERSCKPTPSKTAKVTWSHKTQFKNFLGPWVSKKGLKGVRQKLPTMLPREAPECHAGRTRNPFALKKSLGTKGLWLGKPLLAVIHHGNINCIIIADGPLGCHPLTPRLLCARRLSSNW